MGDPTTLLLSIIFGSLGVGYFIYLKKQQKLIPLIAGLALCIYPYFVPNIYMNIAIGVILIIIPWIIKI